MLTYHASKVFSGTHPRAISEEARINLIRNMFAKITFLKLLSHLSRGNASISWLLHWITYHLNPAHKKATRVTTLSSLMVLKAVNTNYSIIIDGVEGCQHWLLYHHWWCWRLSTLTALSSLMVLKAVNADFFIIIDGVEGCQYWLLYHHWWCWRLSILTTLSSLMVLKAVNTDHFIIIDGVAGCQYWLLYHH